MLPDFLIVGAMKSGTSTLAHYLRLHDQIFIPARELHFFDKEKNYGRGLQWYKKQFAEVEDEIVVGEKTPTYSYKSGMPKRIYQALPDVRLIWIFREPVSRSYSNYWHAVRAGSELLSFEEAVQHEEERRKRHFWKGYVDRSVYIRQVERFKEYFDLKNMHFILFEEFKRNPARILARTFSFLGVEDLPNIGTQNVKRNTTHLPRSILAQYMAKSIFGNTCFFRAFKRINRRSSPGYPQMKPEIRRHLKAHFQEPNQRLEELIDKSLSDWK